MNLQATFLPDVYSLVSSLPEIQDYMAWLVEEPRVLYLEGWSGGYNS
jgi:hypothetical protein